MYNVVINNQGGDNITPGIYLKLLIAYIKGSIIIKSDDKNLEEMLDKNYIYSEIGDKTFYVNGFPVWGTTNKRFITTEGRKAFGRISFKVILPSLIGISGLLLTALKLLLGN